MAPVFGALELKSMLLLIDLAHGTTFKEKTQISSCVPCIDMTIKTKQLLQTDVAGDPRRNWS
jgi:hypothetical protein